MTTTNCDKLQHKIQSLEHSLCFLQEQHESTLNGLHEEIAKLQQKCAALINQLAQTGVVAEQRGVEREASLKEALKDAGRKHAELKETLEKKEERIRMLESQSKSKEMKYLKDLKHYQMKAAELQTEIEHKSASVAYLTAKLHQNQLKDTVLTNEAVSSGNVLLPSPPKGNPNRQHERKNIRCVVNSPAANVTGFVLESSSIESNTSYVLQNPIAKSSSGKLSTTRYKHSINDPPRPALGHSQNRRDHDMILFSRPKPTDYEDFIRLQSDETIAKPMIEPLPPIASSAGKQFRQGKSKNFSNKKSHSNLSGEIETVIVDPGLSSPDRPCGKLQDLS